MKRRIVLLTSANTKILWAFLSEKAKRTFAGGDLVVKGTRLDGPSSTWQRFAGIGYAGQNGAPSFASIIVLPSDGCWRLQLGAGGLHASVVFEATTTPSRPPFTRARGHAARALLGARSSS